MTAWREMSLLAVNAILSFALYPPGIFPRTARIALMTFVPAGLMSWVPAELVLRPTLPGVALLVVATASVACASLLLWTRGLRRYESGNLTQAPA